MNSKAKGSAGEREFAALCRDQGYNDAHRAQQQYTHGIDHPDVAGLPGIHIEVKRCEKLNIYEAMAQSIRDSEGRAAPIVAHRRNRSEWLITMRADNWFSLYREWDADRYLAGQ